MKVEVEKEEIIKKDFIILRTPPKRINVVLHRRAYPEQIKQQYRMMMDRAIRGDVP